MSVQLQSTDPKVFGKTVKLPIVHKVTFTEEGILEVETQEIANQLLAIDSLNLVDPKVKVVKKDEEKKEEKKDESKEKTINPKNEDGSLKTQTQLLNEMTKEQLQDMVKDFPKTEWMGLNKAPLIEYVIKKLEPVIDESKD